jgi:hypothetical protein
MSNFEINNPRTRFAGEASGRGMYPSQRIKQVMMFIKIVGNN